MANYKKFEIECAITISAFYESYKDIFPARTTTQTAIIECDSAKAARDNYAAALMAKHVELAQTITHDKYTGIRTRYDVKIKVRPVATVSAAGVSKEAGVAAVNMGKAAARKARKARQKAKKAAARKDLAAA